MRQVQLVVQVATDEDLDRAFTGLAEFAQTVHNTWTLVEVNDVFVADDGGFVERP